MARRLRWSGLPPLLTMLVMLSGCFTGGELPTRDASAPEPGKSTLTDGWDHYSPGGEFRYENGHLKGSYEGDLLVLRINNTDPLVLTPMKVTQEGAFDFEKDLSFSLVFAAWEKESPWPEYYAFSTRSDERIAVGAKVAGHHMSHGVRDEASIVLNKILLEGNETTYYRSYTLTRNITFEPGDWTVWFATPNSHWMDVEIELPAGLELAEPPSHAAGCDVVRPSDFQSSLMLQGSSVFTIAEDARWTFDLPENATLMGSYFGGKGISPLSLLGLNKEHRNFHFPNGTQWSYRYSNAGEEPDPPDWNGLLPGSTTAGEHTLEIAEERTAVLDWQPKVVYCVI